MIQRLLCLLLPLALLSSCAQVQVRPLLGKTLHFQAADFGPESMSAPLIGSGAPSREVWVVHRTQPQAGPGIVQILPAPAIKHLNRCVSSLPRDAAHHALRTRLIHTRSRILDFYNERRNAFMSVPPFSPRSGYFARQMILPGLGTTR